MLKTQSRPSIWLYIPLYMHGSYVQEAKRGIQGSSLYAPLAKSTTTLHIQASTTRACNVSTACRSNGRLGGGIWAKKTERKQTKSCCSIQATLNALDWYSGQGCILDFSRHGLNFGTECLALDKKKPWLEDYIFLTQNSTTKQGKNIWTRWFWPWDSIRFLRLQCLNSS